MNQTSSPGPIVASTPKPKRWTIETLPKLPCLDLFKGDRRHDYLKIAIPLYEASIRYDWKAAKAIFDRYKHMDLVRYSITENGETALHVAATVKRSSKQLETFVKNLVDMMEQEDLKLQNKKYNTALYLAAVAGNIETVKVLLKKNRSVLMIPGAYGQIMPLYAAARFGNYEMVKYLYANSNELADADWNYIRFGLLETCVEGDMLDVALKIVTKYPNLGSGPGSGRILENLARKPSAFSKKISYMKRSINAVFALFGLTVEVYQSESEALQLLKIIWKDINDNKSRFGINGSLQGSDPLTLTTENLTSEKVVQTLQLQKLITELLEKLDVETMKIMGVFAVKKETKLDPKLANRRRVQALQLQELIDEHLVKMHVETKKLIKEDDKQVSGKEDQALPLQKLISRNVVTMHVNSQNIVKRQSEMDYQGWYLQKLIYKHITTMSLALTLKDIHSYRVIFIAAEMGNTKFLVELIRRYPELMWKVNDKDQTIFHIAVKGRHAGIYSLLYEIGSMNDMITKLRDADENNMLHLAAKCATKERLADVSGPAFQMQRELLWFKEVKNMIPPYYREQKNKDGLTPRELFTKEHKDLIKEGKVWMKGTASQCTVVAALMTTMVFAAALTVSRGYNQNNGLPLLYRKPVFVIFVVADAISLFLSAASLLIFLSILTSRYTEDDFVTSLPTKLVGGLVTLFLSIAAMMLTFSTSFFIVYHKEIDWIPISISVIAFISVVLYAMLQYHLLIDVISSTHGSKRLFKRGKQILYVNPRV